MRFGLLIAAFYCVVALLIYVARGAGPFERNDTTLGRALAAYLVSGVFGGAAYGVLHPLSRSVIGVMLIGVVCAMLAFFAIEITTSGMPNRWGADEWQTIAVLGLVFGPVGGFIAHKQRWGSA